jgi:hypothetical protein
MDNNTLHDPLFTLMPSPPVNNDPRCFLEAFNDLANVAMTTNHHQITLEAKLSTCLSQQRLILDRNKEIIDILKAIKGNGVGQARLPGKNTQFQPSTETQLPPLNYNTLLGQHVKGSIEPMKLYSTWFIDRMKESYETLEKKTSSNRSSFARYKMAMAVLVKLSGKYPPTKPSSVTLFTTWEATIKQMGKEAVACAGHHLKIEVHQVSITKLGEAYQSQTVIERDWPIGMPKEHSTYLEKNEKKRKRDNRT